MGRNQQLGKVCVYVCVCLYLRACAGEAVEVGVTEVEVNRQLEKKKGNTGESFCCCDQTCPCDTHTHAHKNNLDSVINYCQ